MPPRDPRLDFADDGGTPMWRRRQTVIDVAPRGLRGLWWRWWHQPFLPQALQVLFVAGVLPWIILFGGIILLGIWDALFGAAGDLPR